MRSDKFLVLLDTFLVHSVEVLNAELDVADQSIAPALTKVLTDNHAKHLHLICVWRHSVGRDDPPSGAKPVRERELIILPVVLGRKSERDQGQALAGLLAHYHEAQSLQRVREIVSVAGQVRHDCPIAFLSQSN